MAELSERVMSSSEAVFEKGDRLSRQGYEFEVERMDGLHIESVRVTRAALLSPGET